MGQTRKMGGLCFRPSEAQPLTLKEIAGLAVQVRCGVTSRFYGVAVSTADSESADLGSSPSRTFQLCFYVYIYSFESVFCLCFQLQERGGSWQVCDMYRRWLDRMAPLFLYRKNYNGARFLFGWFWAHK